MSEKELRDIVLRVVLTELARAGERFAPVTSSNRHVHLSQADVERLFGAGYRLAPLRSLVQPGQYACKESVVLEGPKGSLVLRVVGPVRGETQIELSTTDCFKIGVQPVLRMSGDSTGTPGGTLVNGDKRIAIAHGIMVAARHLHMAPEEAAAYGLRDGDKVALQIEGDRAAILENMVVRSGPGHVLEAHIDKDEANACGLSDGQLCRILSAPRIQAPIPVPFRPAQAQPVAASPLKTYVPQAVPPPYVPPRPAEEKDTMMDLTREPHRLLTEDDVRRAAQNGFKRIRYAKDAILTPLARDIASDKGIELIELL